MAAEPARRPVVLRPAAAHLRRVLDAGSWVLLEELLSRSVGEADASTTTASIRDLAGSLGVSKNTVGRAVDRLRSLGLLTIEQTRTDDGVFASTTYRVSVPSDMFDLTCEPSSPVVAPVATHVDATKRRTKRAHPTSDSQLSLLDV